MEICQNTQVNTAIMIDCSHGNSQKDYTKQPNVLQNVVQSMTTFDSIIGVMLESNLVEGKQKLIFGQKDKLKYGVSITDSCINIQTTQTIILNSYQLIN